MKHFVQFIAGFLTDKGIPSSKRLIGIICGLCLCFVFVFKGVTHDESEIPSALVESVAFLAFGSLGLTTIQQVYKSKSFDMSGGSNGAGEGDNVNEEKPNKPK
jgi:hypothetical protein